ncbi:unnamed protein product [Rotaria magnacalcarata]|uniref:Uncharacterized protein n=1 Tax=Rotaria magnacalcarata TaxID=392030 RepID=A0A816WXF7_9BILA|nr:unnamed protein product [Rotaria magnacalcarata]CAF2139680.1 unnamed protein product [Rotaria magnacalcarata]
MPSSKDDEQPTSPSSQLGAARSDTVKEQSTDTTRKPLASGTQADKDLDSLIACNDINKPTITAEDDTCVLSEQSPGAAEKGSVKVFDPAKSIINDSDTVEQQSVISTCIQA